MQNAALNTLSRALKTLQDSTLSGVMNVDLRRSGPGLWPRSRTTALLWNENMLLGKPLLSCHAAQRQEPAWHLAIRGLAEPILSVKQREREKTYQRFGTKQKWHAFVTFATLFGSWVTFLITFIQRKTSLSSTIPLSGPFRHETSLCIFTRSHIPYWLPFKSISSEIRFWKSPQLRGMLNIDTRARRRIQNTNKHFSSLRRTLHWFALKVTG